MQWLGHFERLPRKTFVVQGEQETALGFGEKIHADLGWNVEVPEIGQGVQVQFASACH